jgi:two-component system, response regulator RegA
MSGIRPAAVAATAREFSYAVLDLRLPDRDGLGVVRMLRETRPEARIVVVTDADSFATVVLALRAGADGFVPKPVGEGELIDALLDRAPPLPPVPQTPLGLHRTCWEHVMRLYEQCDRNMTRAAGRLGMHRRSLQRFLSKRAPPPRASTPAEAEDRLVTAHLARASSPGARTGNLLDR